MIHSFLSFLLVLAGMLSLLACSAAPKTDTCLSTVYVGSTPGDAPLKTLLSIATETKVDFIKWNLTLTTSAEKNRFLLTLAFGESQPNTLGFKQGGQHRSLDGTYTTSSSNSDDLNGDIYHLKSSRLSSELLLIKVNDNLFHVLTPEK